jgi:L-threonylcarbamoyladenylate synthase
MGTRGARVSVIYFISKLIKWDDLRMKIINNPTQYEIKKAAKALKEGHLVAFPTETVYGLGADATNKKAVNRIYSVKRRPTDHPLIVHISSIDQLDKWAINIPEYAVKLANEFWPGPMTLILKRSNLAKDFISGGQDNVGLRVPSQSVALELLKEFEKIGGQGVAAPSANRFGAVSPTNAEAVKEELGFFLQLDDIIIDGGQCLIGVESTILDCTGENPQILRPGKITEIDLRILGISVDSTIVEHFIKFSGSLKNHYSPRAKINLNCLPETGEGFIALSNVKTPIGSIRLAAPDNAVQFAQQLYAALRLGDSKNLTCISVIPPTDSGIAIAINDRLSKASQDR